MSTVRTSAKPAWASAARTPAERAWGWVNAGRPASSGMRRSATGPIHSQPPTPRNVEIATVPPGRSARRQAASAARASGRKKMPNPQVTASNEPSGTPGASASPTRTDAPVAPAAASRPASSSTISGARSRPSTDPPGRTASRAASSTAPRPLAMSSTRSPGCRPAASTNARPSVAK